MKKTYYIVVAFIISIGIFLSCSNSKANGPAQTDPTLFEENVSVRTVEAMKGQTAVVVLDVREFSEHNQEHIPGVVHIPLAQALARKSEYISHKIIFVTCRSGNRSGIVTQALREAGYTNVHNMAGGIRAWKNAGFPVAHP